jgi:hypothetical protein
MDKNQLRDLINRTLTNVNLYSEEAVNLLMGTAAQESRLGVYIKQINGPALGVFQMEPNTFYDICNNYLKYKTDLSIAIRKESGVYVFESGVLEWNLKLAICTSRVHYLRCPGKLPNTIEGMAAYWKKYYNTPLGKGTEQEFIANYKKYVL